MAGRHARLHPGRHGARWPAWLLAGWLLEALLLAGCASRGLAPAPSPAAPDQAPAESTPYLPGAAAAAQPVAAAAAPGLLGSTPRLWVVVPAAGDTFASLARHWLGSAAAAWQLAQANAPLARPLAGQPLVVPRVPRYPLGVTPEGVQGVVILCYHRLGLPASKMSVSPANFTAQLDWLAAHGYQVVRLAEVADFLAGRRALPPKAVAITFDDGYESVHRHAFAALRQRGLPATLFVYTDFLGSRDALSWAQMTEMQRSGLIDVQAHSRSHRSLTERDEQESPQAYRQRLDVELRYPRAVIERQLATPGHQVRHFAYPYGDASDAVFEAMRRHRYELGLTVVPGSNPFFASALQLKRVMIYGDHSLADFSARLQGRRDAVLP